MPTSDELAAVKRYMRVDGTDDDATIGALYAAVVLYLDNAGINKPTSTADLYILAVHSLTLHWYENRGDVVTGTIISEIPLGLRPIINQLKLIGQLAKT